MFDRNGDGYLEPEELGILMRLMGAKPTENEVLDQAETCADPENISLTEAKDVISNFPQPHNARAELTEAFKTFDQDESGTY
jgi:calmodulin